MPLQNDQESYKAYMQSIVSSHVDLSWFQFGDEKAIKELGSTARQQIGIWADEQKPVQIAGAQHDNFMKQYQADIAIMTPRRDGIENQQADYHTCEEIAHDIITRINADWQIGYLSTDINRFKWGEAEIKLNGTAYTACKLEIYWQAAADLTVNPDKWQ